MTDKSYRRKLTAILSADVAGYSRLMGDDEVATVSTLKSYREIITEKVEAFNGRVVDSPGDNILSEFRSIVDAVKCAVAIQEGLREENEKLPENRKMNFRIGVNLGDVIQDGDRIYGDGVNIAARIEGLADPGGVALSGTAFDNVRNKLDCGYQFSGEHTVKNIANPVRVYKILTDPECAGKVLGEKRFLGRISRRIAMSAILISAIIIGGLVSYYIYLYQSGKIETDSTKKMVFPRSDEPSIAVLPFVNMSDDPKQQYFGDGMSEQIITGLSQGPYIYVTSRTSSFAYRDKNMTAQQITDKLGVHYLLEGSVQREDDRVRIHAQLIDGQSGNHIWAKRYDREYKDLFALQDEITMDVMSSLNVKMTGFQLASLSYSRPKNLDAYELYLKGMFYHLSRKKQDIPMAHQALAEALKIDPDYGPAYRVLGFVYCDEVIFRTTKTPGKSLENAEQMAQKALEVDPDYPPYTLRSQISRLRKNYDDAIVNAKKGIELEPNEPYRYFFLSLAQRDANLFEDAIPPIKTALQLARFRPVNFLNQLAWSYFGNKQFYESIKIWDEILSREPKSFYGYLAYLGLAASCELTGDHERATWAAENVMQRNPKFSLDYMYKNSAYKDSSFKETVYDAFRKAGLK
jgi:adenylate cyclase